MRERTTCRLASKWGPAVAARGWTLGASSLREAPAQGVLVLKIQECRTRRTAAVEQFRSLLDNRERVGLERRHSGWSRPPGTCRAGVGRVLGAPRCRGSRFSEGVSSFSDLQTTFVVKRWWPACAEPWGRILSLSTRVSRLDTVGPRFGDLVAGSEQFSFQSYRHRWRRRSFGALRLRTSRAKAQQH